MNNKGITFKLKKEGYNVLSAMDISTAKELFKNNEVDLIVSDINLPDGSGLKFCEKVRQVSDVLIVFLTVLEREIDIVTGYEIGADDYITKPFSLMIFISKINELMKRLDNNSSSELLICNDIVLDRNEMLQIEGMFYTSITIVSSLVIGSVVGYFVYLAFYNSGADYASYKYPFVPAILLVLVSLVVQIGITHFINNYFKKESLVDRVRYSE
ncbi:MAG: response regulator [Romboutsia sp.]